MITKSILDLETPRGGFGASAETREVKRREIVNRDFNDIVLDCRPLASTVNNFKGPQILNRQAIARISNSGLNRNITCR